MSEIVAESSAIRCSCLGSITGDMEQFCVRCLDAYTDAVIQRLEGQDLMRELERIAAIVADVVKREPDIARAAVANLAAQAAVQRAAHSQTEATG